MKMICLFLENEPYQYESFGSVQLYDLTVCPNKHNDVALYGWQQWLPLYWATFLTRTSFFEVYVKFWAPNYLEKINEMASDSCSRHRKSNESQTVERIYANSTIEFMTWWMI